jgi:glycosyl transferase family 25
MEIFVISLKDSYQRRNSISKQLTALNLPFHFIDAVKGSELSQGELDLNCNSEALRKNPQWLNAGAIGCAMSHKNVYDQIIENHIDVSVIIEDDMILPDNFAEILRQAEKRIHPSEVILLYYRAFNPVSFSSKKSRKLEGTEYSIYYPVDINNIPITTGAYMISLNACRSLRNIIYPIHVASDSWKYFLERKAFDEISVVFPRALKDANFKSDIEYLKGRNKLVHILSKVINKTKPIFIYKFLKSKRAAREKNMSQFKIDYTDSTPLNEKQ